MYNFYKKFEMSIDLELLSKYRITSNNAPPLIILAPLKPQKKVSSTSNNSRPLIITALGTRQVIFVFFRPTVKKITKNCLGPFQMRGNKKLIKNRSGKASIMKLNW